MRQYVLATAPSGKVYRWGEDEPHADGVLQNFDDEDAVPGGYKTATGSLPRKPGVDYGDMAMGTHLETFGAGELKVGEYRLERAPRNSGDYLTMDPAAFGYQGHLADDESAQGIPIDADMSQFGEPSASRVVLNPTLDINQNGTVSLLPAGSPVEGEPKVGTKVPAISHKWSHMNNIGGTHQDTTESWYDSNGVRLGKVMLDWLNVKSIGNPDTNWENAVWATADDIGNGGQKLKDFDGVPTTHFEGVIEDGKFFLLLSDHYVPAFNADGSWEAQWRNVRIFDRSGIPVYGTWPEVGVLFSDVIAYALERWAPLLRFTTGRYGTIQPTEFVIPHLPFKEAGPISNWVTGGNRFELNEWGVWNDKTFWLNQRGKREGRKRWRARVRPTKLRDTGQQMDRVWNGVLVQWQDVDGRLKTVAPPGSGYQLTDSRLLDTDPENPANQIPGQRRWTKIALRGVATAEGAIRVGQKFLEMSKELDGSGQLVFDGYIEDEHSALWPYYCAHSGDVVDVLDASIPGDRYVINCQRKRGERKAELTLDAPKDALEALLEQLDIKLVGLGMA